MPDVVIPAPAPAQVPLGIKKQPLANWIPLLKVEVAVPVTLRSAVWIPPAKVEVAVVVAV